jgi:hypothetical protein
MADNDEQLDGENDYESGDGNSGYLPGFKAPGNEEEEDNEDEENKWAAYQADEDQNQVKQSAIKDGLKKKAKQKLKRRIILWVISSWGCSSCLMWMIVIFLAVGILMGIIEEQPVTIDSEGNYVAPMTTAN